MSRYLDKLTLAQVVPFVLELPFDELPLYVNCPHEKVRNLVKNRIGIGK